MNTHQLLVRPQVIGLLLAVLLTACQGSSISAPEGESESQTIEEGAQSPELSGEAGTATLRIERSGTITNEELQWAVAGEFPITIYFDPDDTSPIFWTQGEGMAEWSSVDTSQFSGITVITTATWDVEFEVRGAFNAQNCSIDLSVNEVWAEGAEVRAETSEGVVLEGITEEFIIFTTNSYEYNNLHFPYGVGEVTKTRKIGNVDWEATFTIINLEVPDITHCGTFDYAEETIEPTPTGN